MRALWIEKGLAGKRLFPYPTFYDGPLYSINKVLDLGNPGRHLPFSHLALATGIIDII